MLSSTTNIVFNHKWGIRNAHRERYIGVTSNSSKELVPELFRRESKTTNIETSGSGD
jgi:hypothetical protein